MPGTARAENWAEIYFAAAQEHKTLALELHEAGRYVISHYLAGLAVECMLRAYHYRINPVFSGRHDLLLLYQQSQFDTMASPEEKQKISVALAEVSRRWSNSHRYRSERELREYLRRANLGKTGKFVRESSRIIVRAAEIIVEEGISKWSV